MKTLITGANGMMGNALCSLLRAQGNYDLHATDIHELDVREQMHVDTVIQESRPDIILHLAALTDVDYCEKNPHEAYHTNTIGTQNLALACQRYNIPMLYVSTLSVFDGTKPDPYHEYDRPNPQSHYSNSKYQGELIIQSLLSRYYIIRAGWMFGGGKEDKKFVAKIIDLAHHNNQIKAVDDKFGSPVYTMDISAAAIRLLQSDRYGLYHTVNSGGPVSRFEVAKAILAYAKIHSCEVLKVNSTEFPLAAHRPRMEAGINLALELTGLLQMRHWHESLQEYIETVLL